MNTTLIGITGKIGAGKDTVGKTIQWLTSKHLQEVWSNDYLSFLQDSNNYPSSDYFAYRIKKYAAKLKQIASLLTGIDVRKFEDQNFKANHTLPEWGNITVREFLQKLGTEAIRNGLYENAWINALFADYNENERWVITDVRFPNEYNAIKERGGIIIKVDRCVSAGIDEHISEKALDFGFPPNYTVWNTGSLDNLKEVVVYILKNLDVKIY